jgi:hypothetical protein
MAAPVRQSAGQDRGQHSTEVGELTKHRRLCTAPATLLTFVSVCTQLAVEQTQLRQARHRSKGCDAVGTDAAP